MNPVHKRFAYHRSPYRFKDEVELSASDHVKLLSPHSCTFVLIVSRVEEADLGVNECKATNKVSMHAVAEV